MPCPAMATAEDVAHALADWLTELGYLEQADALQIVRDEFGDEFVWTNARGQHGIRCDVLAALTALAPEANRSRYFMFWNAGPGS